MILRIERLGPLKKSSIELGDITLLLGPPNTGKSYTLKALYAKLFPLDEYTSNIVGKMLSTSLKRYLDTALPEDSLRILHELLKAWIEVSVIVTLLSMHANTHDRIEEILRRLMEKRNFELSMEKRKDTLLISIKTTPIELKLNSSILDQTLKDVAYMFMNNLVPVESIDAVILEPMDAFRVNANYVMRMLRYEAEASTSASILERRRLLFVLEEVLDTLHTLYEHVFRRLKYKYKELEKVFPPYLIIRRSLTRFPNIELETSVAPSQYGLEIVSALTLTFGFHISVSEKSAERIMDEKTIKEIIDEVVKEVTEDSRLWTAVNRAVDYMRNWVLRAYSDAISDNIYRILRELAINKLGYDSLRFIPFGRSTILLGLESASREPYFRARRLHSLIDEFYPSILASYAYWASKGRGLLLDGKLTEEQKKLVEATIPLLEGVLTTDGSGRLLYRDWRGSNVEIQMASALVGEVSGLLLPLLTVRGKALVLIEEPEAQLHPSAQIIMALFLASLPKLCNCKVIASTHSDLLAITLSQLAVQKPDKEWIEKLIRSLLPHIEKGIETLASTAAMASKDLNLRIYEYTRDGMVKPVKPEDVLSKEVPGISKVIDILTDWAFRLAAHRSTEGRH